MRTLFVDEGRFVKRWAWSATDDPGQSDIILTQYLLSELWCDQVRCVQIKRTQKSLDAAFVDIGSVDSTVPGLLPLKGRQLNDGQRVWAKVQRLPRVGKGASLSFVGPAANSVGVGDLHPDSPLAFDPPYRDAKQIFIRRTEQTVAPGVGGMVEVSAQAFDDLPAVRDTIGFGDGGILLIEVGQTLTAIDVNTGQKRGANLDAAPVVAQQIWRQNLCGLIVIDFIRPETKAERQEASQVFTAAYQAIEARLPESLPRPRVEISAMDHRGLIIIERERLGTSTPDRAVFQPELAEICEMLERAWAERSPRLGQSLFVSVEVAEWLEPRREKWQPLLDIRSDTDLKGLTFRWSNDER